MTPLDKIQEGITLADWNLVSEGYRDLTGKKIEPPSNSEITIEKVIAFLHRLNCSNNHTDKLKSDNSQIKKTTTEKKSKKTVDLSVPVPSSDKSSDFVFYDGNDIPMSDADKMITKDLKKRKIKGVPRIRDEYVPDMVNCQSCGQIFDSNKTKFDNRFIGENGEEARKVCNSCVNRRK